MQKFECDLVIGLQKDTLRGWLEDAAAQNINSLEHPQIKIIADYCM